ncbi:hypothetical protein AUH73_05085 [archaeon 13_1_40CM_4_53_4]|nr:MAG: hypothetical protein AUI07_08045 [archaeon 13_2_20CM_2_53_6]OLC62243.1 MAG: hypothetical protein AUH73_05085 [archaeon 13_1_40CM_4_53_4]
MEIVEVNVQVSVKSARGQIACSDLRSGLVLWLLSRTVTERGLGSLMAILRRFWLDIGGLTSARYWARVKLVATQVRRSGDF